MLGIFQTQCRHQVSPAHLTLKCDKQALNFRGDLLRHGKTLMYRQANQKKEAELSTRVVKNAIQATYGTLQLAEHDSLSVFGLCLYSSCFLTSLEV